MNPQDAIDFSREAIMTCMMVGGPILVVGLLIGLLVGVFQAMTQVQDQTVSFVPKILLLLVMISLCLPWLSDKMLGFAKQSFETPMTHWHDSGSMASGSGDDSEVQVAPAKQTSKNLLASFQGPVVTQTPTTFATPTTFTNANSTIVTPSLPPASPNSLPLAEPSSTSANTQESQNPFILPHYRISKAPKTNTGG